MQMTRHDDATETGAPIKAINTRQQALQRMLQEIFSAFAGIDNNDATWSPEAALSPHRGSARQSLIGYGWAALACALATALSLMLRSALEPANLVLLYLLAVVLVTVRFGHKAGILASFLGVLAFDLFLVPPYYSFTVHDTQEMVTFGIMLIVALIIGKLTADFRRQAMIAHYRERRAHALFELSRELSAALTNPQIVEIGTRYLEALVPAQMVMLLPDRQGILGQADTLSGAPAPPADVSTTIAQQAYVRQTTLTIAASVTSNSVVYLPLRAPMRTRGILVVTLEHQVRSLSAEQERLLLTCAAQIALAIERVHYVDVAQRAELAMESERMRNALLSAISHDLRTPLTAIVGLSSTLATGRSLSDATRRELAESIQDDAIRMTNLITNLLDMARLHAGAIKLNRQWQLLEEVVGGALAITARVLTGMDVEIALPATLPLLDFDAVLMERVFCNLLENAAKYGASGGQIRIAAEQVGPAVRVSVEDRGPGIPIGMEEAIFAKFTRGAAESNRSGVGLGLSICRTVIEAHGGKIWVEQRDAGGARFVFAFPLGEPPADHGVETLGLDVVS